MSMTIDSKKILASAKRAAPKKNFSFTIDEEIGEDFKAICDEEKLSYSSVAEAVFRDFVESHRGKKKEK
jgi:hypothetical protein